MNSPAGPTLQVPVESPRTLEQALEAMQDATEQTAILAGGTDLMVEFEIGRTRPDRVVNIWGVQELRGISAEGEGLRIGALTSCAELIASGLARARADILCLAADKVGAEQIKNRATLGGNLGTASPAADLNPVLSVLEARVRLVSATGRRELPVQEFLTGYRSNARRPQELIESIFVPARPDRERRAFRKVGTRRAQSISKVVVALAVQMEAGVVVRALGAAGSVAPSTVMLPTLAQELVGKTVDEDAIDAAARAAARMDCAPMDDVRSTAAYRRLVLQRLLRTMLTELLLEPPETAER